MNRFHAAFTAHSVRMVDELEGPGNAAIAARIRLLQKAMKLNGALFAKRCEISPAALSNYRTGYRRPSIDQAGLIAGGTGAPVDWILYGRRKDMLPGFVLDEIRALTAR